MEGAPLHALAEALPVSNTREREIHEFRPVFILTWILSEGKLLHSVQQCMLYQVTALLNEEVGARVG